MIALVALISTKHDFQIHKTRRSYCLHPDLHPFLLAIFLVMFLLSRVISNVQYLVFCPLVLIITFIFFGLIVCFAGGVQDVSRESHSGFWRCWKSTGIECNITCCRGCFYVTFASRVYGTQPWCVSLSSCCFGLVRFWSYNLTRTCKIFICLTA